MKIQSVPPVLSTTASKRKLIPLSEHNGPILELTFWEQDKINILEKELKRMQYQTDSINLMLANKKGLTGYQKNKCKYALLNLYTSIECIKEKISDIKRERFAKQMRDFLNKR